MLRRLAEFGPDIGDIRTSTAATAQHTGEALPHLQATRENTKNSAEHLGEIRKDLAVLADDQREKNKKGEEEKLAAQLATDLRTAANALRYNGNRNGEGQNPHDIWRLPQSTYSEGGRGTLLSMAPDGHNLRVKMTPSAGLRIRPGVADWERFAPKVTGKNADKHVPFGSGGPFNAKAAATFSDARVGDPRLVDYSGTRPPKANKEIMTSERRIKERKGKVSVYDAATGTWETQERTVRGPARQLPSILRDKVFDPLLSLVLPRGGIFRGWLRGNNSNRGDYTRTFIADMNGNAETRQQYLLASPGSRGRRRRVK